MIIGIDLAKEKFDVNYINSEGKKVVKTITNKLKPICKFLDKLPDPCHIVAEHTGGYSSLLVFLANQLNVPISLVGGYEIKHSLGLQRGKSDDVDAARIREYGERFHDRLKAASCDSEAMTELKSLYVLRFNLVKTRKQLNSLNEKSSAAPMMSISAQKHNTIILNDITERINVVEDEINELIKKNDELANNYTLIKSITGIGPVIASDLIIKTENFKKLDTASKCAAYAGVAPYKNESGKMKMKARTSNIADKKLKTLLYMGAKTAIVHNKEYRLYYQRKRMEGKPHFLIMNNVCNKLLRTIYAVVHNQCLYDRDYICFDPRHRDGELKQNMAV